MSVFREITIEFKGKDYTFVPSNKILRRIDTELAPQTLFGVLGMMDGRNVPMPALALIIQQFLNAGGGNFTEDEILLELYADIRDNDGKGIRPLMEGIAKALAPEGVDAKNSPAPRPSAGGSKAKSKSRT
jgi:hypothetical protein